MDLMASSISLFQFEWCAGGDGHLGIVVLQDLEKLLVGENILVVGLLEEDVVSAVGGINVSGKVLLGHEADDIVACPRLRIRNSVWHGLGGVCNTIGLQELAFGNGCGQFFSLDVVINIVVEAGKVIRSPGGPSVATFPRISTLSTAPTTIAVASNSIIDVNVIAANFFIF